MSALILWGRKANHGGGAWLKLSEYSLSRNIARRREGWETCIKKLGVHPDAEDMGVIAPAPPPKYNWRSRYTTRGLLSAGAVAINGVFIVHEECKNADGGLLWEFSRTGNRWRLEGMCRARYAHNPEVRAAFPVPGCAVRQRNFSEVPA